MRKAPLPDRAQPSSFSFSTDEELDEMMEEAKADVGEGGSVSIRNFVSGILLLTT